MSVFKTKWFSKTAKLHAIYDNELCQTIEAARQGQAEDLGGGVYKKRLAKNRDRAIILAKGGQHWFYTFLYAKQDISNISHSELAGFKELAKHYAYLSSHKLTALIHNKELLEICHDHKS